MGNRQSDIYLYAKNWYKQTNMVEDYKKIFAKIYALEPQYVRIGDIKQIMLEMLWEYWNKAGKNAENSFTKFMHELEEWYHWDIIKACDSYLGIIEVKYIEGGLDAPDPELLPLAKEDSMQRWNQMHNK